MALSGSSARLILRRLPTGFANVQRGSKVPSTKNAMDST